MVSISCENPLSFVFGDIGFWNLKLNTKNIIQIAMGDTFQIYIFAESHKYEPE